METAFCFNCDDHSVFDYSDELDATVCVVCECEGY